MNALSHLARIETLRFDIAFTHKVRMEAVAVRTLAMQHAFITTANNAQREIEECNVDLAHMEAELETLLKRDDAGMTPRMDSRECEGY